MELEIKTGECALLFTEAGRVILYKNDKELNPVIETAVAVQNALINSPDICKQISLLYSNTIKEKMKAKK